MKKILAIIVALVLCLSLVAACSDGSNEATETETDNVLDTTVVGTVDGYEITQAEFNCHYYVYYSQYSQYEQYYGEQWMDQDVGDGQTMGEVMITNSKKELEQFVTAEIMAEERYGITADTVKETVDEQFDELIESYGSEAAFNDFLVAANTTKKALRKYFERYEIFSLLAKKMLEEGTEISVTDEEIRTTFDEQYSGKLKVQHILISTVEDDGITAKRTNEEAMKIATEVLEKLENGEDFDALIEEYDEDPGMTPGNYYVFGDGEMVPEFETASKQLAPGEYTKEAVLTSYGYHIIKRYSLDETSDEYKNMELSVAQNKAASIVETEAGNRTFNWEDTKIDESVNAWVAGK